LGDDVQTSVVIVESEVVINHFENIGMVYVFEHSKFSVLAVFD